MKLNEKGNQALVETLASEGGPLQSGALPELDAATEGGKKAVLDAITNQGTGTNKTPKNPKKEEATKAEPKTILEYGSHSPLFVFQSFDLTTRRFVLWCVHSTYLQ